MKKDYVFTKAPLVEVIAEIHWALKRLDSSPETRIDPFYDLFKEQFLESAKHKGFSHVQELIPQMVPIELVSDQPHLRLRTNLEAWPLVQIGPGVLTANIVPPYRGWSAFEPFLRENVDRMFESYPLSKKTLRIERLHLRYIDAFDESFGLRSYATFASEMLGMPAPLSASFLKQHVQENTTFEFIVENRFENKSPKGSSGNIKLSPGTISGRDAAILELRCESQFQDHSIVNADFIMNWFGEAHQALRAQFESLSTDELKAGMGDRIEIGE